MCFLMMGSRKMLFLCILLLTLTNLQPSTSDREDESCLTHLSQSLEDPQNNLQNWTKSTFSNPCSGFTSYIQGATCNNARIYKLSLSNISLKGSISPYIASCTNLQALDLSSNSLSGPIPTEIRFLVNLAVLNLSDNRLSGQIPPELAVCVYLNIIDLHDNVLIGSIPQQLGQLARLSVFDVSNNRLAGEIPVNLGYRNSNLPRINATSYEGNKGLYGYPLPPKKKKGLSILVIVGIGLGSGMLSLVLSFSVVFIWLRFTQHKMAAQQENKITHFMPDY